MSDGMCITTKHIGPTTHRGARVKATHKRDSENTFSKTVSWDHSLGILENYQQAAEALIAVWPMNRPQDPDFPGYKVMSVAWDHDHYYFTVGLDA